MSNILYLIFAVGAGMVLGLVYFLSLWETVKRLTSTRWPVLWTLGSLVLRMAFLLTGLYLIGYGHWDRLIAALIGILLIRTILVRRLRHRDTPRAVADHQQEPSS